MNGLLKFCSGLLDVLHEVACITNRLLKLRVHILNKLLEFFALPGVVVGVSVLICYR